MKVVDILTRRNFVTGTAGAMPVPQPAVHAFDKSFALEQVARALHECIGRYADGSGPTHIEVCSPLDDRSITLEMEILRPCSVHEIQDLLTPLFEGGES